MVEISLKKNFKSKHFRRKSAVKADLAKFSYVSPMITSFGPVERTQLSTIIQIQGKIYFFMSKQDLVGLCFEIPQKLVVQPTLLNLRSPAFLIHISEGILFLSCIHHTRPKTNLKTLFGGEGPTF